MLKRYLRYWIGVPLVTAPDCHTQPQSHRFPHPIFQASFPFGNYYACSVVGNGLRHERVMGFVFAVCVLQFLPIRLTQQSSCCICVSTMKHQQKLDWKSNFFWFICGYWKCMFADFFSWIRRASQFVFIIECRVIFEDAVQSLLNICVLWGLLFDPHRSTYTNHIR